MTRLAPLHSTTRTSVGACACAGVGVGVSVSAGVSVGVGEITGKREGGKVIGVGSLFAIPRPDLRDRACATPHRASTNRDPSRLPAFLFNPKSAPTAVGRSARRGARGVTLIEMLIVLALIAIFSAAVIAGSGQLSGAKLRKGATMMTAAVRVAFLRATVTSRSVRLVLDFEQNTMWLEEADLPMLVQGKDRTGTGGADGVTAAEKTAIAEGERIVKGPTAPRPAFHAVEMGLLAGTEAKDDKNVRHLPSGITLREVQAAHDDEPRTKDRAYLYFWPGGLTERASIVLRIGTSTEDAQALTVMVSPLTGTTSIKAGAVALKLPTDDRESSEREDRGP
jgi:general secretion pathway protein H